MAKMRPKRAKRRPKTAKRRPKMAKMRPKRAKRRPKRAKRRPRSGARGPMQFFAALPRNLPILCCRAIQDEECHLGQIPVTFNICI